MAGDDGRGRGRGAGRQRPLRLAGDIRASMIADGLRPGDRLPDLAALAARFGMARGTIRAALVLLEAQGLVEVRPGGAFRAGPGTGEGTGDLLGLLGGAPGIAEIHEVRRLLEPDLVAGLAGRLPAALLDDLAAGTRAIPDPCDRQVAALAFHARLAGEAENPVLGRLVAALLRLLTEMTLSGAAPPLPEAAFRLKGEDYRLRLIGALREGRAGDARRVMRDHLETVLHLAGAGPHRMVAE